MFLQKGDVVNKFLMSVALVMVGCSCYAGNIPSDRPSDGPLATSPRPIFMKKMGMGMDGKNKAIMDVQKQLLELKKFKVETIRQNLKIDTKALGDIINKKISDLKLSNATFDSLRTAAKDNMERMAINKLENKFLKFQMMLKIMIEGFPKDEGKRSKKTDTTTDQQGVLQSTRVE